MTALSATLRDELHAQVRDMPSFQATDFEWRFEDVEFHAVGGLLGNATPTAQRKPLMICTHRDDNDAEFRVTAVQRGNSHQFDLVCEFSPALMFTSEVVELGGPEEIRGQMTRWLAILVQRNRRPTLSSRVDELVDRLADKLAGLDEPYSEPTRARLQTRLGQLAALALVMREAAEHGQRINLTDAHRDTKYLADHLAEIPRGRAMRWIVGSIARVDFAWRQASGSDDAHGVLQELWDAADLRSRLGEDYRTRARLTDR